VFLPRLLLAGAAAAVVLMAGTGSAFAGTIIGQIAPVNPPTTCSGAPTDFVQPSVTSGASYSIIGQGTKLVITSWSTSAYNGPNQTMTLKIWRQTSGNTYLAVTHDGPRPLTPGVVNTFSGLSIPVQLGDYLGLNRGTAASACLFAVPGQSYLYAPFSDAMDNTTSNDFTLGAVTRDRKKGTATVSLTAPNLGQFDTSGRGVKTVSAPGINAVYVPIAASGKAKRKLKSKGKVTLTPSITYTPNGGSPKTQSLKVTLKKKI
jgi:hypothetical protein